MRVCFGESTDGGVVSGADMINDPLTFQQLPPIEVGRKISDPD